MTVPERIHKFLTSRTPDAVCDDCVADRAEVSPRQQVNPIVSALALTTDFERNHGECAICKRNKLVTRSLRYA